MISKWLLQGLIKQREKTWVTIFRLANTSLHQVYFFHCLHTSVRKCRQVFLSHSRQKASLLIERRAVGYAREAALNWNYGYVYPEPDQNCFVPNRTGSTSVYMEPFQASTRDRSGAGPERIQNWTCKTAGAVLDPFRTGSRTVPCKPEDSEEEFCV